MNRPKATNLLIEWSPAGRPVGGS